MTGRHAIGDVFPAQELCIGDVGLHVQSSIYRNKNKTSKPVYWVDPRNGTKSSYLPKYKIESIYVHSNGNILINQHIYLRVDTEIVVINDSGS